MEHRLTCFSIKALSPESEKAKSQYFCIFLFFTNLVPFFLFPVYLFFYFDLTYFLNSFENIKILELSIIKHFSLLINIPLFRF